MDKRLLIVLPLCLAIMLGWGLLADSMGWVKKPVQTAQPAVVASDTPATAGGVANVATPSANDATQTPAAPTTQALVGESTYRELVLEFGASGEAGHYRAVFQNQGGTLAELRSGEHVSAANLSDEQKRDWTNWTVLVAKPRSTPSMPAPLSLRTSVSSVELSPSPLEEALWKMEPITNGAATEGVRFTYAPGTGVTFEKRVLFTPNSWNVKVDLSITNDSLAVAGGTRNFVFTPAAGVPHESGDSFYVEPQAIAYSRDAGGEPVMSAVLVQDDGSLLRGSLPTGATISFVGIYNKYFAALWRAADPASANSMIGAGWRVAKDEGWLERHPTKPEHAFRELQADVDLALSVPPRGETRTWNYVMYVGPKMREPLIAASLDHGALLEHDLGFVSSIARVLIVILEFFESITNSWGAAIILLTISVRLILFPINRRSQTAMGRYQTKMKRIQPKIEEMKKRYEKDPQRLRQEQAKIMQQEGAFPPLGGCLPPLLQIPIFIGLFRALGVHFDLRQAEFMSLIHDLALPDRLIAVDFTLPFVGHVSSINVLPPLMVAMWIWQQRSMPMPTEEQARMMYKMMMWMPVVMGVFLYNYAAGLSLYMITQSALGVIEQKVIRKYWPVDETEIETKKSGLFSKLMAAQEQRMKQIEAQRSLGKAKR